jgi:menaquinone reductase, multiheme cytochrome c subunit
MKTTFPFLAGAVLAVAAGWTAVPRVVNKTRLQPVDFSHKVHAEKAGAKCEDCHALREDGSFAGLPTLEKCSGCHAAAMGSTAAEKRFIDEYVTPAREPVWASYARQPENVWFPHAAHVKRGSLKCAECHGTIESSDSLPRHREDRISGYSSEVMGMNACIDCHRKNKLEHSCLDCHK